jgi:hypothetical protein
MEISPCGNLRVFLLVAWMVNLEQNDHITEAHRGWRAAVLWHSRSNVRVHEKHEAGACDIWPRVKRRGQNEIVGGECGQL